MNLFRIDHIYLKDNPLPLCGGDATPYEFLDETSRRVCADCATELLLRHNQNAEELAEQLIESGRRGDRINQLRRERDAFQRELGMISGNHDIMVDRLEKIIELVTPPGMKLVYKTPEEESQEEAEEAQVEIQELADSLANGVNVLSDALRTMIAAQNEAPNEDQAEAARSATNSSIGSEAYKFVEDMMSGVTDPKLSEFLTSAREAGAKVKFGIAHGDGPIEWVN